MPSRIEAGSAALLRAATIDLLGGGGTILLVRP
jgi:hypothetical protein